MFYYSKIFISLNPLTKFNNKHYTNEKSIYYPCHDRIDVVELSSRRIYAQTEQVVEDKTFHQVLKQRFIEGGPFFMGIVLVTLILGLAIAIERIIYLNMATTNTDKLVDSVEEAMSSGGVEAAKELCRNTKGPVASIYQGLDRMDEGVDAAEKAVVAYGGVQMGLLRKTFLGYLFIALAPMLGFMGTVIGMISAFDSIEAAGDISPAVVAERY